MSYSPQESYRTHSNYLDAWYFLLDQRPVDSTQSLPEHLYSRITASRLCCAQRRSDINIVALKKSLSNAWGIETILYTNKIAAQDDSIIRLSNNWTCIQAYYTFYHCTQAILIAKGNNRPDTHAKTQKAFINLWSDRKVDLAPWTLTYDSTGVINLPFSAQVDMRMHVWNHCDSNSCWSLACKSLKSTRSESYDEALIEERNKKRKSKIQSWEKDEKTRILAGKKPRKKPNFPMPQLVQHEKQVIAKRLRAYSLFDYLYRLRIKTNYVDSDMFTEGPVDEFSSIKIADQLCAISSATILLTELYLMSIWGKDNFLEFRKSWVDSRVQTPVFDRFFARAHLLTGHKIL